MTRLLTVFACFIYVVSPIDLLPEAILGPFGLVDDIYVAVIGIRKLLHGNPPCASYHDGLDGRAIARREVNSSVSDRTI